MFENQMRQAGPVQQDDAATSGELRCMQVPARLHGQRIDRVLADLLPEFSRSWLAHLLTQESVELNGRIEHKNARKVRAGDQLQIKLLPTPQSRAFVPQALPLRVVYEDEHVLVIDKAAGMVVHPAPGHWSGTLLNALLARDERAATLERAGIVHRLDRDTSGLMMVARSSVAQKFLMERLAQRQVVREYLALVQGEWSLSQQLCVDAAIGRDPRQRVRMAVVDLQTHPGKSAQTRLQCLQSTSQASLLLCRLQTGRTHQIRVHLAHLGYPLLGDGLYGGRELPHVRRQALHAWHLAFEHPVSGESMDFTCPPPADFAFAMQDAGLTMVAIPCASGRMDGG